MAEGRPAGEAEIGRGGRHAAVNAVKPVIDGGFVSVLHVYDLVIIAESKKLYPSKQKALYAWLYLHPRRWTRPSFTCWVLQPEHHLAHPALLQRRW